MIRSTSLLTRKLRDSVESRWGTEMSQPPVLGEQGVSAAALVTRRDLRFNSRIERAFSEVRLTGPSNERVALPAGP
jgi:hypothetical protein